MAKVYKQTEEYTCGPSAYLETFYDGKKSKKEELNLHEAGRVKPSRIFLGPSLLALNPSLNLYTTTPKITEGILRLTHNPNVPDFRNKMTQSYTEMMNAHPENVYAIKGSGGVKSILDQTLDAGKKALLLTHSGQWLGEGGPHWVSVSGKNKGYEVGDPYTGKILNFSENDLEQTLKMLKGIDFPLQIVTDFKAKK